MRNGRSRHTRQSGDRRRRSSSSDRIHPFDPSDRDRQQPPHDPHVDPRELDPRDPRYDGNGDPRNPAYRDRDSHHPDRQYPERQYPERRSLDDRRHQDPRQFEPDPRDPRYGEAFLPPTPRRNKPKLRDSRHHESHEREPRHLDPRASRHPQEPGAQRPPAGYGNPQADDRFQESERPRRPQPKSARGGSAPSGPRRPERRNRPARSSKRSSGKRKQSSWQAIAIQGFILSVSLGLLCGLVARWWGSALSTIPDAAGTAAPVTSLAPSTFIAPSTGEVQPGAPIDALNLALEELDGNYPELELGTVLVDISQRNYAGVRAQEVFPAASTIKLAVLAAVMESVDNDGLALDERLPLQRPAVASAANAADGEAEDGEDESADEGDVEAQSSSSRVGDTQISVLAAAELMISTSDNTATNALIERLGGMEVLNDRFGRWGLKQTELLDALPDAGGTNTSSPADFALLLGEIERGQILSMRSRDRFFDILAETRDASLLPQGLSEGDRIAHKTGTIDSSLGDVGLVDLPNGERYIVAVMVRRANSDPDAVNVIREVSRLARDYWGEDGQAE